MDGTLAIAQYLLLDTPIGGRAHTFPLRLRVGSHIAIILGIRADKRGWATLVTLRRSKSVGMRAHAGVASGPYGVTLDFALLALLCEREEWFGSAMRHAKTYLKASMVAL